MKFEKYVAAGNDFIIFLEDDLYGLNYFDLSKKVCHRKFGIGADGILIVCKSILADIKMIYINSDGSEGEMCGNGIRCFAKYIYDNNIMKKRNFFIETLAGVKEVEVILNDEKVDLIKVNMGEANFFGKEIPMNIDCDKVLGLKIDIKGITYEISAVRVGVPHVVIFIEDMDLDIINSIGNEIENHELFPEKTNVNFAKIINKKYIKNYTWERGAGRTLGCGTGACAVVAIGNMLGLLDDHVDVKTEGGLIGIKLDNRLIEMVGKANLLAAGEYILMEERI